MALSSGSKTALGEAASWGIAGIMLVGTFVYFDELKANVALRLSIRIRTRHISRELPGSQKRAPATARQPMKPRSAGYVVELAAGAYGHYKTPARVNGRQINVLVDTGASYVALTHEDAERAGVFVSNSDYKYKTRNSQRHDAGRTCHHRPHIDR